MDLVNLTTSGVESLYNGYLWTWQLRDRRVDGWPLMSSLKPTALLIAMYYCLVYFGPRMMKERKPFNLKGVLLIYNTFVTVLNAYICFELAVAAYRLHYSWFCQPVNESSDPEEMRIVRALYLYYVSKLIEFLDTTFFILRKKNNQLSFLHVYHHSTMFFFWWMGCRWVPGGSAFLGPMINAFIHVLMYSYYGLSALGPNVRKYLWWKQYLTIIQLIQFTGGLILGINAILTGCTFTRWMQYLLVFYMFTFMILFGNFYRNAYRHGLRAAYRMEMKKREVVIPANSATNGTANGNHTHQSNGKHNGHAAVLNGVTDTLRMRGKASLLTSGLLAEEVAPHLAKHGTS